jgi:hypothetical protein
MASPPPSYPSLNQQWTYNGIIYVWNGNTWVETDNTNYSFNQIQINGVDSFNSFKTRNINFQGINLVIYSGGVNTLVFSASSTSSSSSTFSGGTVSGPTNFTNGLSANTIYATTYQNLPINTLTAGQNINISGTSGNLTISFTGTTGSNFTGGTVSGPTNFISGLTANTISATTYQNLPISGVTNGSGISTSITNGNLTITATGGGSSTGLTPSDYVVQGKLSANQSISANTDVIIQFVDDFDPKNWWNSSTYQLTPTIAGYYNIFVGVWLDNPGVTNNQANVQVRKNGNSFVIVQNPLNNVTGQAFEASKIVYLNGTTDYIEFTIFQGSTGSVNILQGTANGSGTWFSASLIVGGNSEFTGGTVSGATRFTSGLTANTISATTYQNLPATPFLPLTGGTITGNLVINAPTSTNNTALNVISQNTSESIALRGLAGKGTNAYGVYCDVSPSDEFNFITNGIGGYFNVGGQLGNTEPTNKYSLQLIDGTEGVNKVLTSVTIDGKANWSSVLTGLTNVRSTTISATTYQGLPFLITFRRLTSSSTLDSTDLSTVNSGNPLVIEMNVSSGNTITIPPNSAVTFSIGSQITISQYGTGQTTIVAGLGVTLRSSGNFLKLAAQYSMATLMKVGTNEWYVVGQLVP